MPSSLGDSTGHLDGYYKLDATKPSPMSLDPPLPPKPCPWMELHWVDLEEMRAKATEQTCPVSLEEATPPLWPWFPHRLRQDLRIWSVLPMTLAGVRTERGDVCSAIRLWDLLFVPMGFPPQGSALLYPECPVLAPLWVFCKCLFNKQLHQVDEEGA